MQLGSALLASDHGQRSTLAHSTSLLCYTTDHTPRDFVAAARGVCKTVTLYDNMSVLQAEADRREEEGDETVDPEDQRR